MNYLLSSLFGVCLGIVVTKFIYDRAMEKVNAAVEELLQTMKDISK